MHTLRNAGIVLAATLIALAAVVVWAILSSPSEEWRPNLRGTWSINARIHDGPDPSRFGQIRSCTADLKQAAGALSGTMNCGAIGSVEELSGSVRVSSGAVRFYTAFPDLEVNWEGTAFSHKQISGKWNDSDEFSGIFTALRTSSTPTPTPTEDGAR